MPVCAVWQTLTGYRVSGSEFQTKTVSGGLISKVSSYSGLAIWAWASLPLGELSTIVPTRCGEDQLRRRFVTTGKAQVN